MMTNYIQLTHYSTGDTSFVNVDAIVTVSQGFDRALVITTAGQGSYYRESAEYIMECIEANIINRARIMPEHGVCDLGPLVTDIKTVPLYQVVSHWDTSAHREVETSTFENRLDAIDCFKEVMQDFQDTITQGGLDLDECDFENKDDELPTVYMQDCSGEGSIRISVREVSVL